MRRKRQPPDTRPKWDDPDLPFMGKGLTISATKLQTICQESLAMTPSPHWSNDPTYNLRKPRKLLSLRPLPLGRDGRE